MRGTGRGGYIIRKLNKPDSPEFKFMSDKTLRTCGWIRYSLLKAISYPYRQSFKDTIKIVRHIASNSLSIIQTRSWYIILSSSYYNSLS